MHHDTDIADLKKAHQAMLSGAKGKRVLIIGDAMLDHYVYGRVQRISPEAPVPVVEQQSEEYRLGGAANVLLNVLALGMDAHLVAVVGNDAGGDLFCQRIKALSMDASTILRCDDRPTTIKTRVMSSGQQMLRIDRESTAEINPDQTNQLIAIIRQICATQKPDVIVIEDYDKGVVTEQLIAEIRQIAENQDIKWAVDPKKRNFLRYQGADLMKPNLKELRDVIPFDIEPNAESLQRACEALRSKLGHKATLVTLSEHGVFAEQVGVVGQQFATDIQVPIADVSGAGDTVMSIVALGLATGASLASIATLANRAGVQVCMKPGVVPINYELLITNY
jgi:D-glycero-beta-D-manno-heptose-7-phosphate kinase